MNCYAKQAVLSGLQTILPTKNSDRMCNMARIHLPYLLHPVFGETRFIILNRHYKPLGIDKNHWCYYERPEYSSMVIESRDVDFEAFTTDQRLSGCFYFYVGFMPSEKDYASVVMRALKIDPREF